MSIENGIELGKEYPLWDSYTLKLLRDCWVEEAVAPPLYKWLEYTDDDRNPLGVTDGKVLNLNEDILLSMQAGENAGEETPPSRKGGIAFSNEV